MTITTQDDLINSYHKAELLALDFNALLEVFIDNHKLTFGELKMAIGVFLASFILQTENPIEELKELMELIEEIINKIINS